MSLHRFMRRGALVNRRNFLELCALMGVGAVVALYSSEMKRVIGQVAEESGGKVHLIWLNLASDTGCTISMLQASNPDLVEAVESLGISADFWKALMTPDYDLGWVSSGYTQEDLSQVPLFNATFGDAPVDVLVVEGTPQLGTPTGGGLGYYCTTGRYNGSPVTGYELLQKLASKASYVVAIGQCSSFGGIPAGKGNLTGAVSVIEALRTAGVTTKRPIINIPGCPANPDWTIVTLTTVLQGFDPDLDELGRPKAFFSSYIHDNCPRRDAYNRGQMAKAFDDPVGCFWDLGCRGPITQSACAKTKWNSGISFCTQAGPMCWGCMHPNFPDSPTSGFFSPIEQTPTLVGLTADDVGELAVAGTAGILAVHALRHVLSKKEDEAASESGPQTPDQAQEAKP
jgi:NiFe hydrogenase small subunit HydA